MQSCLVVPEHHFYTDEQLVMLAQNGHMDAFDSLIVRYGLIVNVRASCYRGTGIEPEDLAQEGMIGLMRAVRNYRPDTGACFCTFAQLCINRSVMMAIRTAFRKKQIPKKLLVPLNYINWDSFQDGEVILKGMFEPEKMVIAQEDMLLFWEKTKRRLSPFEYNVLVSFIGGNRYREIAMQLNTSVKAVNNALQRIRQKLKQKV